MSKTNEGRPSGYVALEKLAETLSPSRFPCAFCISAGNIIRIRKAMKKIGVDYVRPAASWFQNFYLYSSFACDLYYVSGKDGVPVAGVFVYHGSPEYRMNHPFDSAAEFLLCLNLIHTFPDLRGSKLEMYFERKVDASSRPVIFPEG